MKLSDQQAHAMYLVLTDSLNFEDLGHWAINRQQRIELCQQIMRQQDGVLRNLVSADPVEVADAPAEAPNPNRAARRAAKRPAKR